MKPDNQIILKWVGRLQEERKRPVPIKPLAEATGYSPATLQYRLLYVVRGEVDVYRIKEQCGKTRKAVQAFSLKGTKFENFSK